MDWRGNDCNLWQCDYNPKQNRAQLGGAIYVENGSIIVTKNTSFIFNTVASSPVSLDPGKEASGGAIYATLNCSISIQNSYFERNEAYYGYIYRYGGIIAMYQGSYTLQEVYLQTVTMVQLFTCWNVHFF